ncbi:MAG: PQQ-binding-like beta-propeller repeat protein [Gemmataceae bacterium]|nr:PQQ-binding-like beta-propeller repeat protein [Gemmataceae bacterium]
MWSRPAAVGLLLALAGTGPAQNAATYTTPIPPDAAALDRLNLRTEWATYLPVDGRRDSIQLVQTFDDQLFVQTRDGLLIAVDARTGRVQWTAALGNGEPTSVYPVAVNREFVYAANVTRLYAFYRATGVAEFAFDMGSTPTAGLAADDTGVYAVLSVRSGRAGAQRLVAYDLPRPIALVDPDRGVVPGTADRRQRPPNPVDALTARYPSDGPFRPAVVASDEAVTRRRGGVREAPLTGLGGSRSPSLAVVDRVTPPYQMEDEGSTPSLAVVPSLRRPYRLRDESSRFVQRTPSIGSIPPSVAAALALTDLRPRGVVPPVRWEYGLESRVLFTPALSPDRLWLATTDRKFLALAKADKKLQVSGNLFDQVAAFPGQAGTLAYVPLADGALVAVDLTTGNLVGGLNSPWRTNLGGYPNHTPLVTRASVYAGGEDSGVARVDRASGDVTWRTADRGADRVVGVNESFAYVRSRSGRLEVYDAVRPNLPGGRSAPLSGLDVGAFNIPVVNTVSDRVYLAADTGLMVCLRDAGRKYDVPVRMAPPVSVNPVPKEGVVAPAGKEGAAPTEAAPAPKKDPAKKDDPDREMD